MGARNRITRKYGINPIPVQEINQNDKKIIQEQIKLREKILNEILCIHFQVGTEKQIWQDLMHLIKMMENVNEHR